MATKTLQKGDPAPDLTLLDQDGKEVTLSRFWEQGPLVLFFYPQDHSLGCTKEACSFRDGYEDFREAGAEVLGISSDDASSHRRFQEEHELPFRLLSDLEGRARKAFGIGKTLGVLPWRVSFVIDPQGTVRSVFNSQFQFRSHSKKALQAVRKASGQGL
ncbi:MAG: peroxiredoxin [Flavobacteriales bacterium]